MKISHLSTTELLDRLETTGLWMRTGPFTFAIRSSIGSVAEGIRRLYADFPVLDSQAFADFHVTINPRKGIRTWIAPEAIFALNGFFSYDPFALRMAPAFFEWGLNCCISRHAHNYLTLHGAIVERQGKGLVLLGTSGAGKSTLCAALVADGWRLLSDELTLIDPATLQISPLARPISLKNESVGLVRELWPEATFGLESNGSRKGTIVHIRPPAESVERIQETVLPSRVLFIDYQPDATRTELTELAPANAHMRMARHSFNYGVLGELGFETLWKVATSARTFDFRYSNLTSALQTLASDVFLRD